MQETIFILLGNPEHVYHYYITCYCSYGVTFIDLLINVVLGCQTAFLAVWDYDHCTVLSDFVLFISDWHHSDARCSTRWQRGHCQTTVELWSATAHNDCGKQST